MASAILPLSDYQNTTLAFLGAAIPVASGVIKRAATRTSTRVLLVITLSPPSFVISGVRNSHTKPRAIGAAVLRQVNPPGPNPYGLRGFSVPSPHAE